MSKLSLLYVVMIIAAIVVGIIGYSNFAEYSYLKRIPCDHGDKCEFKAIKRWYHNPVHPVSMYCPLHKMYHHTARNCMIDPEAQALENDLIRKREIEIGYDAPPKVILQRPEGRIK